MWGRNRFLDLVAVAHPIVQAPMIGPKSSLTVAVAEAGGLGSLACAALTPDGVRTEVAAIRARTDRPLNLNFFSHVPEPPDAGRDAAWRDRLAPYYAEFGLDPAAPVAMAQRAPFDGAMLAVVEDLRPAIVSFHFGLPAARMLDRLRRAGCRIVSTATTVREARWLAERGVDAIIAQGAEAGGHRGLFLKDHVLGDDPARQVGTMALVPQVVDAVDVPVIAAGGIADARGIAAAFMLGASAVQIGTAYLKSPEAGLSTIHRDALRAARDEDTAITNVLTGKPARGIVNRVIREIGPLHVGVPAFPGAAIGLQPLRVAAERQGSGDFSPLWSGQAVALAREEEAGALTRRLAEDALALLGRGQP
ncbi:NAD(P)H-dependent flavin oxidoreductase [Methylobacterium goesingense]|uniref:Propionate 3-nitronate monooxygenase n=1 Tax=Methylobacterium goesingense TaxID=243690 RepID=A0ABV2L4B5_9HYPH|nr:nitronate monooxygenase family protein [Methylobacterium goesingense]GJD73462.1 Nitronate monooxygenase [Methylobacterium goesingense]